MKTENYSYRSCEIKVTHEHTGDDIYSEAKITFPNGEIRYTGLGRTRQFEQVRNYVDSWLWKVLSGSMKTD